MQICRHLLYQNFWTTTVINTPYCQLHKLKNKVGQKEIIVWLAIDYFESLKYLETIEKLLQGFQEKIANYDFKILF